MTVSIMQRKDRSPELSTTLASIGISNNSNIKKVSPSSTSKYESFKIHGSFEEVEVEHFDSLKISLRDEKRDDCEIETKQIIPAAHGHDVVSLVKRTPSLIRSTEGQERDDSILQLPMGDCHGFSEQLENHIDINCIQVGSRFVMRVKHNITKFFKFLCIEDEPLLNYITLSPEQDAAFMRADANQDDRAYELAMAQEEAQMRAELLERARKKQEELMLEEKARLEELERQRREAKRAKKEAKMKKRAEETKKRLSEAPTLEDVLFLNESAKVVLNSEKPPEDFEIFGKKKLSPEQELKKIHKEATFLLKGWRKDSGVESEEDDSTNRGH